MAWVSATIGAIAGLVLMVMAAGFGGWPLWLVVLLYPIVSAVIATCVLALLYWRSTAASPVESRQASKPSKTPAILRPNVP